jgi:hypothetical protein
MFATPCGKKTSHTTTSSGNLSRDEGISRAGIGLFDTYRYELDKQESKFARGNGFCCPVQVFGYLVVQRQMPCVIKFLDI